MNNNQFITNLYRAIDQFDSSTIINFMDENASFRFANLPAVRGKKNILLFLEIFFSSILGIKHTNLESWAVDNIIIINGIVSYTRRDNTILSVPFSVTLKMDKTLIKEYLIFIDNSELFKPL